MKEKVDLVWLGDHPFLGNWPLGHVWDRILLSPQHVHAFTERTIKNTHAAAWLFWDSSLGPPNPEQIAHILQQPGDVWHAGLLLGMDGLPDFLNYVEPTWMLNLDPPRDRTATSWRLSLRACLVRTSVLKQLGGIDAEFETLDGAALELGCRFLKHGVFIRHIPYLLDGSLKTNIASALITTYDELRFIRQFFGLKWVKWAAFRALWSGMALKELFISYRKLSRTSSVPSSSPYCRDTHQNNFVPEEWKNKVTVLIPTLERYPYLRVELDQLRHQTIQPLEIIILDQTPLAERDENVPNEFSDLPLQVFYQNKMGQCTGWNKGLLSSAGEFILFLGDDADRIAPDFLEKFLRTFHSLSPDLVACIVDEVGADPVPDHLAIMRISDSFPIAMVRRDLLAKSGLMDFAFDRGARADQDLGIRCYLSGGLMIVDPAIRILHHHAPRGGLRKHKARVATYARSRKNLWIRNLAGVTELYLVQRYFTERQLREHRWLDILGTFSIRGNWVRKLLKVLVSGVLLPHTVWILWQREQQARKMLTDYPRIPSLPTVDE